MIDWTILSEDSGSIAARSKDHAIDVVFPRRALTLSTRTVSGMDKFLIDKAFDYVVIDRFKGDEPFWNSKQVDEILQKRRRQIASRSAYLITGGRGNVDLTAPGTRLLAFCSRTPIAPTWAFWCLRVPTFEDACLLGLWWNSTFMLQQLLDVRTEVRGSRMWFGKSPLLQVPVLNPKILGKEARSGLLNTFHKVSSVSFPSLLEQVRDGFEGRILIDSELARSLKISGFDDPARLRVLYASVFEKLDRLRMMMTRD